ncbi:hypothetical protein EV363DRAFT_1293937 [Boletus edulis]|nr:hypothetical protein EV363DRAFT_1293937 [Boletus edulis]
MSLQSMLTPHPPSPVVFPSCRPVHINKNIVPEIVNQLAEHIMKDVGKTITDGALTCQSHAQVRCSQHFCPSSSHLVSAPPLPSQQSWDDPQSNFLNPVVPVWASALNTVDRDVQPCGNPPAATIHFLTLSFLYVFMVLWHEIVNGLPQFLSTKDHEDHSYCTYHQVSWLLPPPYEEGRALSKAAEKSQVTCKAALDFLGQESDKFQVMQREVPEELHFHSSTWKIETIIGLGPEDICGIFWELTELSMCCELSMMDWVLAEAVRINIWQERLSILANLMLDWPKAPKFLSEPLPSGYNKAYPDVEQMVLHFYLQLCYEFFDRCPTLFHASLGLINPSTSCCCGLLFLLFFVFLYLLGTFVCLAELDRFILHELKICPSEEAVGTAWVWVTRDGYGTLTHAGMGMGHNFVTCDKPVPIPAIPVVPVTTTTLPHSTLLAQSNEALERLTLTLGYAVTC